MTIILVTYETTSHFYLTNILHTVATTKASVTVEVQYHYRLVTLSGLHWCLSGSVHSVCSAGMVTAMGLGSNLRSCRTICVRNRVYFS